jgi:2,3-diketo-5-methylthio-1-phosphopentane phosphatase
VLPLGSVLADFDGTACLHDVAEHLLIAFGDPSWPEYDAAWERGEMGAPEGLRLQASMLRLPTGDLIAFAREHCPMDPTFAPFVAWAAERDVPVSLVSDGFGLYIAPLLADAGIHDVAIITNTWEFGRIRFPNAHPDCMNCGTCKMLAVQRAPGPVAFIGEGTSDRYGALYADVVFAKDALVGYCRQDGVPFVPWQDFDDVRAWLETAEDLPGPVAPLRCPGWMDRSHPD